ncbi:hypothetical protein TNCV_4594501 [Trichonephila clavipes]|uniref:Uncharacterized protein n=1 Tax=Trichonephila clavipes TaxID=2585209 RepID=A0A8X7BJR7_TRICX|nr:hypothetical protein TNCV_4594501 [Trichonephila clavipes]
MSLFLGTWTGKQSSIPYHDVCDAGLDFVGFFSLPSDMSAIGLFIGAAETSRNITARVIERDVSGPLHKFLEEFRGFRTRQHRRQKLYQFGSTAKFSLNRHYYVRGGIVYE